MDSAEYPPPITPIRALIHAFSPLAGPIIVALLIHVNAVTVLVAIAAVIASMITSKTFLLGLMIHPERSRFRASFDVMFDSANRDWTQRWYMPLVAAGVAGGVCEVVRTLLWLWRTSAGEPVRLLLVSLGLGELEGVLVALSLALAWGIGRVLVRPRSVRAA
jgi:hypothetical protein